MSRLEIVHLRSSGEPLESLGDCIRASIGPTGRRADAVTVYRRRGLETDVAVHVDHNEPQGMDGPSALALHLANALRAFGLVEHSVWEELA